MLSRMCVISYLIYHVSLFRNHFYFRFHALFYCIFGRAFKWFSRPKALLTNLSQPKQAGFKDQFKTNSAHFHEPNTRPIFFIFAAQF